MAKIRPKTYLHVVVALGWLAYAVVSIAGVSNLANILSAGEAILSAGILAVIARRSAADKQASRMFLFGFYASFAWAWGDIVWMLESWGNDNVPENPIMLLLYVLTNVFILVAIINYGSNQLGKWNRVQMIADTLTILLLCTQFFWLLLFDQSSKLLQDWMNSDFTSILSVTTDIAILIFMLTWKIAIRNGKAPYYFRLFAFSAVLFSLTDLFYYIFESKGLYFPNSVVDIVYAITLTLFAIAALVWVDSGAKETELGQITNVGRRRTTLYLLGFPLLILLLHLLNLIRVSPTLADYGICGAILLIHWSISKYIQLAIENDRLWKSEKEHRQMLEQTVADQAEKLEFLANRDPLTLFCNRNCFLDRIKEALATESANERMILLGVNIDRLKSINEAYGHDAGDKTVLELSKRLHEWNDCGADLARINGDEFGVLLPKGCSMADADRAGREILELCDLPFVIDGIQIKVSLSIGVAQQQDRTDGAQTLMENMGIAIRQAKSQGYHTYQVYNPAFSVLRASSRMEHLLRKVNIEKEFLLYY